MSKLYSLTLLALSPDKEHGLKIQVSNALDRLREMFNSLSIR